MDGSWWILGGQHQNIGFLGEAFEETGQLLEDWFLEECELAVLDDEGDDAGQMGEFGGGFKEESLI